MKSPKLPKKISVHISTSYSNRSFNATYSLGAVIGILVGMLVFVGGIGALFAFSLNTYIDWARVRSLSDSTARLGKALEDLPTLEEKLRRSEKQLRRIQIMLGIEKSPDTVDYGELVFAYKPIIPEEIPDSLDTMPYDSTQVEDEGFYPQVLPTVGFKVSRKFTKQHPGIDFATSEGKPVFATADGVVSEVGYDSLLYGNYVKVKHGKYYETFYAHLQSAIVKKGEKVSMNQILGFVGNTGRSSAPHLHFEVRHKGVPIDPANLFVLKREYKGGAHE